MAGQAHLDNAARQVGFRDYDHWSAWNAHRQDVLSQNPAEAPSPNNWLQNLLARIPIHPAYLLGKVNDAFTQAGQ